MSAAVSTASAAAVGHFGSGSLLLTSALSGSFDVDVATLSALRLHSQGLSVTVVGHAVLAALGANAVGKLALAMSAGPVAFWLPLLASTLAAAGAGIAVMSVMA